MTTPVTHINLLRRAGPVPKTAWALAAVLVLSVVCAAWWSWQLQLQATEALRRRDDAAQQLQAARARQQTPPGRAASAADAVALRQEVEALRARVQAAQALADAVRGGEAQRSDTFLRTLAALAGVKEPGLWLTSLSLGAGGHVEVQGQARAAEAVLRFAHRVNESLQPLALRLDGLEMQPVTAPPAAPGGAVTGAVSFRLY